ncbi:MAG: AI-2E family transporter [Clostridiales bacterium]|nr:AI-2E family transporter [Candidatus Blautia equi]
MKKYPFDNKYFQWGLTAFSVVAALMLLYYGIFHMNSVISGIRFFFSITAPIIYGFAIAYILSSVVTFFEEDVVYKLLAKKNRTVGKRGKKAIRWSCVILSLVLFLLLIYALIMMILPQLIKSMTSIIYSFPSYADTAEKWLNSNIERGWNLDARSIEMLNKFSQDVQNYLTNNILPRLQDMLVNISSGVYNFLTIVKNFLIGAIVSLYLMADKEKFIAKLKMIMYALFPAERVNNVIHSMRFTHRVFGGFISGKLLDSAIIGVLCYIGITILRMPYTILVSVIIGVTNIIPFFGPYLGAIPCILLILLVDPMKGLYFIIFIFILQQFDGNILGPKILGDSTGLSSFMVIVAILIGGGLFGIGGMVIGVPIAAVIYATLNTALAKALRDKELPTDEHTYMDIDCLDPETHEALALVKQPSFMEQHREERNTIFVKTLNIIMKIITFIVVNVIKYSRIAFNWTRKFSMESWNHVSDLYQQRSKELQFFIARKKEEFAKKKEEWQEKDIERRVAKAAAKAAKQQNASSEKAAEQSAPAKPEEKTEEEN